MVVEWDGGGDADGRGRSLLTGQYSAWIRADSTEFRTFRAEYMGHSKDLRIANMMGVSTSPFVDLHKDKVDNMKRNLMDYVKNLWQQKGGGESSSLLASGGLPADTSLPDGMQVKITGNGFPIVPDVDDWSKL